MKEIYPHICTGTVDTRDGWMETPPGTAGWTHTDTRKYTQERLTPGTAGWRRHQGRLDGRTRRGRVPTGVEKLMFAGNEYK
jgi:hypothetical protein